MELKHLRTFLILSQIRNYTQTANELHYAQSNISSHIQQLEKELQVKLFEQIGKKIFLTPDGEKLVPYASRMMNLAEDIDTLYLTEPEGGKITIGVSESLAIYVLPSILRAFANSNPDTKLYLKIIDVPELVPMLSNNSIDIAFILDQESSFPSTITRYSKPEPLSMLVAPSHPLAHKDNLLWEDLQPYSFILTQTDCCYRKLLEHELSIHHIIPSVMLETTSVPVIKESALNNLGICFLPDYAVKSERENGQLVKLPLSVSRCVYSQIYTHKDKRIYPALQTLIDYFSRQRD